MHCYNEARRERERMRERARERERERERGRERERERKFEWKIREKFSDLTHNHTCKNLNILNVLLYICLYVTKHLYSKKLKSVWLYMYLVLWYVYMFSHSRYFATVRYPFVYRSLQGGVHRFFMVLLSNSAFVLYLNGKPFRDTRWLYPLINTVKLPNLEHLTFIGTPQKHHNSCFYWAILNFPMQKKLFLYEKIISNWNNAIFHLKRF